jgi:hypothetical protein
LRIKITPNILLIIPNQREFISHSHVILTILKPQIQCNVQHISLHRTSRVGLQRKAHSEERARTWSAKPGKGEISAGKLGAGKTPWHAQMRARAEMSGCGVAGSNSIALQSEYSSQNCIHLILSFLFNSNNFSIPIIVLVRQEFKIIIKRSLARYSAGVRRRVSLLSYKS